MVSFTVGGIWQVDPNIAATGIKTKGEILRRSADGDIHHIVHVLLCHE